jgi:hypothetical protein
VIQRGFIDPLGTFLCEDRGRLCGRRYLKAFVDFGRKDEIVFRQSADFMVQI